MIGRAGKGLLLVLLGACAGKLHPAAMPAQGRHAAPEPAPTATSLLREFREVHLGMEVRLALVEPDAGRAARLAERAFARIEALEAVLSDWRPTSEVRRLESAPVGAWVSISAPLRDVLALSLDVAGATDGAFDPTVGPLTALWREADRTGRPIADDARAIAAARVGYRRVTLDSAGRRLRSDIQGLRLDLGAVAKGWILDQVVGSLRDSVGGVLAEAGGDIVVAGRPPGAPGWRIAVPGQDGDSLVVLTDGAVSTSGPGAQRILGANGDIEGHVFDPRTARGARADAQVTVLAARGAVSDALATALTVVPNEKRAALAARFGVTILSAPRPAK